MSYPVKTVDEMIAEMLADYTSQDPSIDVSVGSLVYLKTACICSARWAIQKYGSWLLKQIFPNSADSENLEHHASTRGLERLAGESDAVLLARLLLHMRKPPAGGNENDYETWAGEVTLDGPTPYIPSSSFLSASGMGGFSAAQSVDGNTGTKAWDTDAAIAGAVVLVDFGPGAGCDYIVAGLYMDGAGGTANYKIQCSDNGSAWTDVSVDFVPASAGWNYESWASAGSHRYWRLYLTNAPGAGPDVSELAFYASSENASEKYCIPVPLGAGTVDMLIVGNCGNGVPSPYLLAAIETYILGKQPADSDPDGLRVLAVSVLSQTITIELNGAAVDQSAIEEDIVDYLIGIPPGGTVYQTQLVGICTANGVENPEITTPASDIVLTEYQVVRLSGSVIFT